MEYLFLIGRVLFGCFFLMNAYNHFKNADSMASYAASKGVPQAKFAIIGSGVLLLLGGLSILTGIRPALGVLAIALFLLPVTFTMHDYWKISDPMARSHQRVNFTKNMALLGAALMMLAIPMPWMFTF